MGHPESTCTTVLARLHPPAPVDGRGPGQWPGSTLVRVVPLTLCYDAAHPFEVRFVFADQCPHLGGRSGITPVTWYAARELVTDGLTAMSGLGDLALGPVPHPAGGNWLHLTLRNEHVVAHLRLPRAGVTAFVADMWRLVPAGSELQHIDMDAELALLLLAARG